MGRELPCAEEELGETGILGALDDEELDELGIGMLVLDWRWPMEFWQATSNNPSQHMKTSLSNFVDILIMRYQNLWYQTIINTIFSKLEQKNRQRTHHLYSTDWPAEMWLFANHGAPKSRNTGLTTGQNSHGPNANDQ